MLKDIPAFPNDTHPSQDPENLYRGMTLRDYFAGQALIGLCVETDNYNLLDKDIPLQVCKAFKIADAMMKEREKE